MHLSCASSYRKGSTRDWVLDSSNLALTDISVPQVLFKISAPAIKRYLPNQSCSLSVERFARHIAPCCAQKLAMILPQTLLLDLSLLYPKSNMVSAISGSRRSVRRPPCPQNLRTAESSRLQFTCPRVTVSAARALPGLLAPKAVPQAPTLN